MVVLAEGLVEAMGEKELLGATKEGKLERYVKIKHDDHGHLHLGEIEFAKGLVGLKGSSTGI